MKGITFECDGNCCSCPEYDDYSRFCRNFESQRSKFIDEVKENDKVRISIEVNSSDEVRK